MEFWKSIGRLLKHRWVGPPIIMASIALASVVSALVPVSYQSTAFLVLTTPPSGGSLPVDPEEKRSLSNPLLQFNDGLRTTSAILIQAMATRETLNELGVVPDGPTQLIVDDGRSNPDLLGSEGPFINVEGHSQSATESRDVVLRATERIRAELVVRQRALQAPRSTYITVVDVRPPSAPEPVIEDKLQAGAVTLAGGIIVGLLLAYGVDRWRPARRNRHPDVLGPEEAGVAADVPEQTIPGSAEGGEPRVPISLR